MNYSVNVQPDWEWQLNSKELDWDIVPLEEEGRFHIILNEKSYTASLIQADYAAKTFHIRVNNHTYEVQAKDRFDLLAEQLGLDTAGSQKAKDIKAPMPGLVLDIMVKAGDTVAKGDPVLILEAMKMENVIKADGDGTIAAISIKKGQAVEKNQVLVELE